MISRGRSLSGFERNCCFLNTGGQRFATVSAAVGLDTLADSRSVAAVDWDWDGDLDLWFTNRDAPRVRLFRNDAPTDRSFLALRLVGTQAARDAIGTRVSVHLGKKGPKVLIKTLRAGEGFLGQTTKWLHFGLGDQDRAERLVVRWPDGTVEEFADLQGNRWYQLTQGAGKLVNWSPPVNTSKLKPGEVDLPKPTDRARILLTSPLKLPSLEYVDFEGKRHQLQRSQPTVIHLWASWCVPCLKELKDLATRMDNIQSAGLEVVALSVDDIARDRGAAERKRTETAAAATVLQRLSFPWAAGSASKELIRHLKTAWHKAVYLETDLPLPCSFLIDSQGRLSAIYSGPVDVDTLLADVAISDADRDVRRKEAFPFPGRSLSRYFRLDRLARAEAYRQGGYWGDATRELAQYVKSLEQSPSDELPQRKKARQQNLAQAYFLWASVEQQRGEWTFAKVGYQKALKILPNHPTMNLAHAEAQWQTGERDQAIARIEALISGVSGPGESVQVAKLWLRLGELQRGLQVVEEALGRFPQHIELRFLRAVFCKQTGKLVEAAGEYERLLAQGFQVDIVNNLAWLYATSPDETVRNPVRALELAEEVAQKTRYQSPSALDTLAAAQAANGQFSQATVTARKAQTLARGSGEYELASSLAGRLSLYEKHQPFRDQPSPQSRP